MTSCSNPIMFSPWSIPHLHRNNMLQIFSGWPRQQWRVQGGLKVREHTCSQYFYVLRVTDLFLANVSAFVPFLLAVQNSTWFGLGFWRSTLEEWYRFLAEIMPAITIKFQTETKISWRIKEIGRWNLGKYKICDLIFFGSVIFKTLSRVTAVEKWWD